VFGYYGDISLLPHAYVVHRENITFSKWSYITSHWYSEVKMIQIVLNFNRLKRRHCVEPYFEDKKRHP
jgi:hypothetical protein